MLPSAAEKSFFELDQPNVELVTVKPFSDTIINGEVSSVPLNPRSEQVFTVRLQEFAGKAATVRIKTPVPISKAEVVNMTEDRVLQPVETVAPLTIAIKPYQTLTIKIELAAVKQEGARIGGK
jgi:alpha-mannosidase